MQKRRKSPPIGPPASCRSYQIDEGGADISMSVPVDDTFVVETSVGSGGGEGVAVETSAGHMLWSPVRRRRRK